ncbi:glycoside hydrolase family 16 protein [Paraburkholderia aspalathi]|uniref:glycoside hydrolase family 16 protein n=1 Tax=Paraburkholderia aspalathi TaxID=1324617 RepID=UPI0038BC62AD
MHNPLFIGALFVISETLAYAAPVSLMEQLVARDGYHQGNRELEVYRSGCVERNGADERSWVLTVQSMARGQCVEGDASAGQCTYMSGWIDSYGRWSTRDYPKGMVIIRASVITPGVANATGLWPALWMQPNSSPPLDLARNATHGWPTNGEIDIAEGWGSHQDKYVTALHYGAGSAAQSSYISTEYGPLNFSLSDANQYALAWDFSAPVAHLAWYLKGAKDSAWVRVKEQTLNSLAPGSKVVDCPELGAWFARAPASPARTCYANVFKAGQASGYYLIANLAVGGTFDGSPERDLAGSQMKIERVDFYPAETNPSNTGL